MDKESDSPGCVVQVYAARRKPVKNFVWWNISFLDNNNNDDGTNKNNKHQFIYAMIRIIEMKKIPTAKRVPKMKDFVWLWLWHRLVFDFPINLEFVCSDFITILTIMQALPD